MSLAWLRPQTPFASDRASLGAQYYAEGNVEAAVRELEQAVRQQPENINYLYEYGNMLIESDRSEEAAVVGNQAIEVAPNDVRGYALKARALMWSDPAVAIPTAVTGLEINQNFAPHMPHLRLPIPISGAIRKA